MKDTGRVAAVPSQDFAWVGLLHDGDFSGIQIAAVNLLMSAIMPNYTGHNRHCRQV